VTLQDLRAYLLDLGISTEVDFANDKLYIVAVTVRQVRDANGDPRAPAVRDSVLKPGMMIRV